MLSRIRIFPAILDEAGDLNPITSGPPLEILNRIQDPGGGRSQIQGSYGRLMFVTGEGVLFGARLETDQERWNFLWLDEIKEENGRTFRIDTKKQVIEEGIAYRMWRPSPRHSDLADAPLRSVQEICEELILLTKAVQSTALTRLTNGLLLMPQEISPGAAEPVGDEDPENNPFISDLIEHFTGQIENPGSAEARVPPLVEASYEYLDRIRWMQLHDPSTDYLERDLRTEAIKRLALGLDFPPEVLLGMTDANHWCNDSETEVLTIDRGFIQQDALQIGDTIRTLNAGTGESEWAPVEDIYRAEVQDLPMMELESRFHHSLSTLNHRWPVLRDEEIEWTTSAKLRPRDRIFRAVPSADLPREPIYDDSFVEVVAWFVTEGTCTWPSEKHCQVRIGQSHLSNPDLVAQIRGTLTRSYGDGCETLLRGPGIGRAEEMEPAWREAVEERGMTLFHLNKAAYGPLLDTMESWRSKVLKSEFILSLTQAQLELFLETCALGDGRISESGGFEINQRDPARMDAIEMAGILAGRSTSRRTRLTGGFGKKKLQTYQSVHSPSNTTTLVADKQKFVSYTGIIWCPVTKNGTWLARRNGKVFYTGNTAKQVVHDMWRSHGAPIAEQFCDDLSEAYLRPALQEGGFEDWAKVVVTYDDADVVVAPDRSEDADKAVDRIEIGAKGYRELKGIPESMAPTTEEMQLMIALKMRRPELLPEKYLPAGGLAPPATQQPGPQAGPEDTTNPENGPPSPGTRDGSRQEARTASAKIMGAAELALVRCREIAGSRIRSYQKSCPECLEPANGKPNALVASLIGPQVLTEMNAPAPLKLVAGGSDGFRSLLLGWGFPETQAGALAEMVEVHAARTLFEQMQSPLSSGFAAHVERTQEVVDAISE